MVTVDQAIDAEVARIMAMSDDEIMHEADADDVAWARAFKLGLASGKSAAVASAPVGNGLEDRDALAERLCAARFPTTVAMHPDYYRAQLTEESRERWRVVADAALKRSPTAVREQSLAEAVIAMWHDSALWGDAATVTRIAGAFSKLMDKARALQSPSAKEQLTEEGTEGDAA